MPSEFLEKTVEDIIIENREIIHTRGLTKLKQNTYRQVILPSGRKIDILSFEIIDGSLYFDIYELKRDYIDCNAICQAYDYMVEFSAIIGKSFKSFTGEIIMVGKKYSELSIINNMKIPVNIFTYDYQMTGIYFNKISNYTQSHKYNEYFTYGLWSFGCGFIGFPNGHVPNSLNLANVYEGHSISYPNQFIEIKKFRSEHFKEPFLLPPSQFKKPIPIKTEVFPEQPQWSMEFSKSIPPPNDFMEDFDTDDSDYEITGEDDEYDIWDFEPEYDNDESDYEENEQQAELLTNL